MLRLTQFPPFLVTFICLCRRQCQYLSLLARSVLGVNHCEFGVTDIAKCVLDILTDLVVHALAHLCCVVDLVLENFENIVVDIDDCIIPQWTRARLLLDLFVQVRWRRLARGG